MNLYMLRPKWPLTAIIFWIVNWIIYYLILGSDTSHINALLVTSCSVIALSYIEKSLWRKAILVFGFLISWFVSVPGSEVELMPNWGWLVLSAGLLLAYPIKSWSDAPLFPTPSKALTGLSEKVRLPVSAKILDAGCGLGHGLKELKREFPEAELDGIEWSFILSKICAIRCPWANIHKGDLWKTDWSNYDMVYLFQRPESMYRTSEKMKREMKPKAWLVSLEFELTEYISTNQLTNTCGKTVWLYQMPLQTK